MDVTSPLRPIFRALDADRQALAAAVERVPVALRGTRPAPDRWSVAEVLEHLAIVERRVAGMFAQMGTTAPMRAPGSVPRAAGDYQREPLLDRGRRIEASEFIQPRGALDADTAWATLGLTRQSLRSTLEALDDRDLTGVSREHPILGTLNGYQWIAALGGHEARHALQIHEIADSL